MSVIRIENFGGIRPSISPRALPPTAAQRNESLQLNLDEFRPVKADVAVATCPAGTKTLHRFARKADGSFNSDPSTGWITATDSRNYVKGQVNDERTERTYMFFNDGSARPRAVDVTGEDRVLGVPRPVKPVVSVTVGTEFTLEEANGFLFGEALTAYQQGVVSTTPEPATTEPNTRFTGTTIHGGPYSNHGLTFPNNAAIPVNLQANHWNLYAVRTVAQADELGLNRTQLGAFTSGGNVFIPLTCLPFTLTPNSTTLLTAISAVEWPADAGEDAGTAVLDTASATNLRDDIVDALAPSKIAKSERDELNDLVEEFSRLVTGVADITTPPIKPTEPTRPTVAEYVYDEGSATRDPLWVAYDAALTTYYDDLADYNDAQSEYESRLASVTSRLKEIQTRCAALTATIEEKVLNARAAIAYQSSWLTNWLQGLGGVSSLVQTSERNIETRFYVVTFVTDWGEESEPSEPSELLEVDQNDACVIARPASTSGDTYAQRNIAKWRVYRSQTGSQTSTFQFVDEVLVTTASFTDEVKGASLGEPCPTITWSEPPYRMDGQFEGFPKPVVGTNPFLRGGVGMPNGIMAAFFDNTVAFCEPYVPYAWPVEYQITTEFPVVGLGVFGQTLVACTAANPYFIYGADSASMTGQKMDANQACVAARTIASVAGGVLYASPDGLVLASQQGVSVVTAGLYTREDWQALNPSTMFAAEHEGIYYLFHSTGTLTFAPANAKLGHLPIVATAAYVDRLTDTLYVASGTNITAVFGGASRRSAVWRSGRAALPLYTGFAWLQVLGDQTVGAPATVRWYGNGSLVYTATVTDTTPVRLPPGRWVEHEIEIESASRITRITLAGSTSELQGA